MDTLSVFLSDIDRQILEYLLDPTQEVSDRLIQINLITPNTPEVLETLGESILKTLVIKKIISEYKLQLSRVEYEDMLNDFMSKPHIQNMEPQLRIPSLPRLIGGLYSQYQHIDKIYTWFDSIPVVRAWF
jgi:hypothetical protein